MARILGSSPISSAAPCAACSRSPAWRCWGLVWSDQGRDVLVALIEFADGAEHGHSIAGLLFLAPAARCSAFRPGIRCALAVAGRTARAAAARPAGLGPALLPRLAGALPLAMAAVGLWTARQRANESVAQAWAIGFGAAAALLLAVFAWRGDLCCWRWHGRLDRQPCRAAKAPTRPPARRRRDAALTLRVIVWSIVLTLVVGR